LREIEILLDMEIECFQDYSVFLYQNRYLTDLLLRYEIEDYTPITILIAQATILNREDINITEY
jgi:hypothetical protein